MGSAAGSLLAVLVVPQLAGRFGWQAAFGVLSIATWIFIAIWHSNVYAYPAQHPELPEAEKAALAVDRVGMVNVDPGAMGRLLLSPAALSVYVVHMAYNNFR